MENEEEPSKMAREFYKNLYEEQNNSLNDILFEFPTQSQ